MKHYETLIIIHPALETSHLKETILELNGRIEKMGGHMLTTEIWGKRRLAYAIDKQKFGTYVLLQYNGEKVNITEFNLEAEHDANVLAYMTIRIEEDEIREQKADLDTQIAGTVTRDDSPKSSAKVDEDASPEEEKPQDDQEVLKSTDEVQPEETDEPEESEKPEDGGEPEPESEPEDAPVEEPETPETAADNPEEKR